MQVSLAIAFERGEFSQTLLPKDGGHPIVEDGMYLWIYMQQPSGEWRLARIAGTIGEREEC
jgi:ketosteroid isomerase-like protein